MRLTPRNRARVAERHQGRWTSTTSSSRPSIATICRTAARRSSPKRSAQTRARLPECRIEVLIPDFQGNESALHAVLDAGPDVLNHNTETVPRLYRMARSGGRYARTLELLERSRRLRAGHPDENRPDGGPRRRARRAGRHVPRSCARVDCQVLTIGQYLRPSAAHAPMVRYYHPDEFRDLKQIALDLGFVHVESGPLVRSSYHAHETADAYARAAGGSLPLSAKSATPWTIVTCSTRSVLTEPVIVPHPSPFFYRCDTEWSYQTRYDRISRA